MVQILHEQLCLVGVVPEIGLLGLELKFAYFLFTSVVVKDTSSAHPRAAEGHLPDRLCTEVLTFYDPGFITCFFYCLFTMHCSGPSRKPAGFGRAPQNVT
jgi:hypothetical protein